MCGIYKKEDRIPPLTKPEPLIFLAEVRGVSLGVEKCRSGLAISGV